MTGHMSVRRAQLAVALLSLVRACTSAEPQWVAVDNQDSTTLNGNYSLIGTEPSLAACQHVCRGQGPSCGIVSWNKITHHCYGRFDGSWELVPNPRVTSACILSGPGAVQGCGTGPAPPPTPPPAPPQPDLPRMISVAGGTYLMGWVPREAMDAIRVGRMLNPLAGYQPMEVEGPVPALGGTPGRLLLLRLTPLCASGRSVVAGAGSRTFRSPRASAKSSPTGMPMSGRTTP